MRLPNGRTVRTLHKRTPWLKANIAFPQRHPSSTKNAPPNGQLDANVDKRYKERKEIFADLRTSRWNQLSRLKGSLGE